MPPSALTAAPDGAVANDVSTAYWNPAGLAYMRQNEAMFIYQPWLVDVNSSFAGVGVVLPGVGTLAMSLISMGLMVAARTSSEELSGGVLNMISWPMLFLSGVWFSLEGLHPWVQKIAQIFPLTHMISAARSIMIDGAGLSQLLPQIGILSLMTVVFLIIGSLSFRWE